MRISRTPHRWNLTPRQAIAVQTRLAATVRQTKPGRKIKLVAGADVAFSHDGQRCIAAVVVWDLGAQRLVEEHVAVRDLTFPYVPGLLSFREAPAVLAALGKLKRVPDGLMCDGHGLAHPRRFGIACHLGVITGLPAIGCAKSRLVGAHEEVDHDSGLRDGVAGAHHLDGVGPLVGHLDAREVDEAAKAHGRSLRAGSGRSLPNTIPEDAAALNCAGPPGVPLS